MASEAAIGVCGEISAGCRVRTAMSTPSILTSTYLPNYPLIVEPHTARFGTDRGFLRHSLRHSCSKISNTRLTPSNSTWHPLFSSEHITRSYGLHSATQLLLLQCQRFEAGLHVKESYLKPPTSEDQTCGATGARPSEKRCSTSLIRSCSSSWRKDDDWQRDSHVGVRLSRRC